MRHSTLLKIDGLINLILGLALLAFPVSLVSYLGIPESPSSFYPNILGAVLVGIAIALFVESRDECASARGLGLTGAVAINLCGGLVLGAWLIFGGLELPTRGLIFLWTLVFMLVGLSSLELAASSYKSRRTS